MWQCVAVPCGAFQQMSRIHDVFSRVAVCCSAWQCVAVHCSALQKTGVHEFFCRVAVCCAVCCSAVQCNANELRVLRSFS